MKTPPAVGKNRQQETHGINEETTPQV